MAFLLGLSYAVVTNAHVGMDLIYAKLSRKWQCRLDILGIIFLLLPFVSIIFYQSLDFVYGSWRLNERSVAPMGLPYRWIIKSFIPGAFGLLVLSALSRLVRNIATLRRL
jgi:TRAP-type mannitol/chloroaromatic compound transport system permease small subunit